MPKTPIRPMRAALVSSSPMLPVCCWVTVTAAPRGCLEMRPRKITSRVLSGRSLRSIRARASPVPVASVWETITATATSSPGTNPVASTLWSTGPATRRGAGPAWGAAGVSGVARLGRAATRSVKVLPWVSWTSIRTGMVRWSLARSMICGSDMTVPIVLTFRRVGAGGGRRWWRPSAAAGVDRQGDDQTYRPGRCPRHQGNATARLGAPRTAPWPWAAGLRRYHQQDEQMQGRTCWPATRSGLEQRRAGGATTSAISARQHRLPGARHRQARDQHGQRRRRHRHYLRLDIPRRRRHPANGPATRPPAAAEAAPNIDGAARRRPATASPAASATARRPPRRTRNGMQRRRQQPACCRHFEVIEGLTREGRAGRPAPSNWPEPGTTTA